METVNLTSLPGPDTAQTYPFGVEVHFRTEMNEYGVHFYVFKWARAADAFAYVVKGRSFTLDIRRHRFTSGTWTGVMRF